MQRIYCSFLVVFFLLSQNAIAQQKHWYDTYWASGQVALLFGTQSTAIGTNLSIDVGKKLGKNYSVGVGYNKVDYNNINATNNISLYTEAYKTAKNRELFIYAKPGLSFAKKPQMQVANLLGVAEYTKSNTGSILQLGTGIRWMVNRHAYFTSFGYIINHYTIQATEYPRPVDPYNPFVEPQLKHQFNFKYQKVIVNFGVRL